MKVLISLGAVYMLATTILYAEVLETYDAAEYFELKNNNIVEEENSQVKNDFFFNEVVSYEEMTTENNDSQVEEVQSTEVKSYEKALSLAKSEGKVIMLVIRATDCVYCDKMEMGTLVDEEVVTELNKDFITLHLNQDLEELPIGLQNGMTPNFVFVSNEEDVIDMYPGVRSPKEFIGALEEILVKSK